ncbi:glutathione S-transferase [Gammaproteobacteria bacterium AH-315-M22]|nr:glutathione S-transferase [Gammaproteobacteria bacterium AH-315-M22]
MKLYEFEAFPNPRRVRVFLAEKGIEVPREQINVLEGEHRTAAYKAKNPSATVPCLELDDGSYISGCVAICHYFEAVNPAPALMGDTPTEQAAVSMWQRRVEEGLMDASTTYFHHATPGLGELELYQNKDWGMKNRERTIATMKWLDEELADKPFIVGSHFSIADITALCAIDFVMFAEIATLDDYSNLKRWYGDVSARDSAKA